MKTLLVKRKNTNDTFEDTEQREHGYSIGAHNGVLTVSATEKVNTVISVPDEEFVIMEYAPGEWIKVIPCTSS